MNNLVQNSILDMSSLHAAFNGAGTFAGLAGFTGGSMTNNVVTGNIVYSVATVAPIVWITKTSGVATVTKNYYFNTNGVSMTGVSGSIHDPSPINADPQFADYANDVYGLNSTSLCVMDGFASIDQRAIGRSA